MTSKLALPSDDVTLLQLRDLQPRCVVCSGPTLSVANRKVSQTSAVSTIVSDVSAAAGDVEETSFTERSASQRMTAPNRFEVRPELHAEPPAAALSAMTHGCRPKTRTAAVAAQSRVEGCVRECSPVAESSSSETGSEDMELPSGIAAAMRRPHLRKTRSRGKGKGVRGGVHDDVLALGLYNQGFDSSDDEKNQNAAKKSV